MATENEKGWRVFAIPTNGDPGYPVSERLQRNEAQKERARFERENDATMNYVVRYLYGLKM